MISYEEAKKIALDKTKQAGLEINTAGEFEGAYMFDDSEHQYDGMLPIVIKKENGKAVNYWAYLNQAKEYADNMKEIPF